MYRPGGKGTNKTASHRLNADVPQWKNPGSHNMAVLEDDIRCGSCNKKLNRARFSNTALSKYQAALFAAARSKSNPEDVRRPNCRDCTGGGRQEMFCQGCQKTLGLDRFSKNQRRIPDNAACWDCVQASEDRVGDVKEAIEEQKILEMLENPSVQATSAAAFNTGSLHDALSSINKNYVGNSTHSYAGHSAVSNDSGAVWIRPDTSFPSRDGGAVRSGLQEHDGDSDSDQTTQSGATNLPSVIGGKSNAGWDDSTPIEQAFRRKSSMASYATGGASSGFAKQGAYRADVNQRAMDQHRRDQVKQLQAAHEDEEDDEEGTETASDSDDPY